MNLFVEYTTVEDQIVPLAPTLSCCCAFAQRRIQSYKLSKAITKTVDDVLGSCRSTLRVADFKSFAVEAGMQVRRHAPSRDAEDT